MRLLREGGESSARFSLTKKKICVITFTHFKIFPFGSIHKMQILITHTEGLGQFSMRNVEY